MKEAIEYLGDIFTINDGVSNYVLIKRFEPPQEKNGLSIRTWSFRMKHWAYELLDEESYVTPQFLKEWGSVLDNEVLSTLLRHLNLTYVMSDECSIETLKGNRRFYYRYNNQ